MNNLKKQIAESYPYGGGLVDALDIEASQFGPEGYPVEIAVILCDGRRYHSTIQPLESWTSWSDEAEHIHGLSRTDLEKYGKSPRQVCEELNQFLGDSTVYSDGWTQDSMWLNRLFVESGVQMYFRCSPIETLISEQHFMNWTKYKKHFFKYTGLKAHHALNDAKATANIARAALRNESSLIKALQPSHDDTESDVERVVEISKAYLEDVSPHLALKNIGNSFSHNSDH